MQLAGDIVIFIGIAFMLFGLIGLFKFKDFFAKVLITAKIDTVGAITLITGIGIKHGASFFTLKLVLLIVILLILNPLATHMTARSAYLSGHKPETEAVKVKNKEETP